LEGENFGEFGKFYTICQNFCPIRKFYFEKLSYREYSPIYYPPIIDDSSFAKIFSLQNFVSYSIFLILKMVIPTKERQTKTDDNYKITIVIYNYHQF